jgi:hypothetical protein
MRHSARWLLVCGLLAWLSGSTARAGDEPPLSFPDLPRLSTAEPSAKESHVQPSADESHYKRDADSSKAKDKEPAKDPKRDKLACQFEHKLGKFPLSSGKGKRSVDDIFIIGIAELNLKSRHADVRFQAQQGQKKVSRFLVDYTLDAPDETLRQWQVLARVKTDDEADESLKKIRADYDESVAYRAKIAKMYQALSTRRC